MSTPDLDALELQHQKEEAKEGRRRTLSSPRILSPKRPIGGELPQSDHWLNRFYEGERMVREKKPGVFDHVRSSGCWFVSVDDDPLSVVDGMSQTATVCGGFAEDIVMRGYTEGAFDNVITKSVDPEHVVSKEETQYADLLRELVPGLPEVSFVNSGAEANEKSFALCRNSFADPTSRKKVLCFEGSFHGRTLLSLHASYNPTKRGPFEISGFEVSFAPFPVWNTPQDAEPVDDSALVSACVAKDSAALAALKTVDPLLSDELSSLIAVDEALSGDEYFAVSVEPMQSEGGDRYATGRYFRALRLLTRAHGVPLIFDEVQTGFGLGGTFAWHSRFGLVDKDGNPDTPDAVCFAKRAQVGVVMSVFQDEAKTSTHPASLVRGRLHAESMKHDEHYKVVQEHMRKRLVDLAGRFPELVLNPRATGYAAAFDLPTTGVLMQYIPQRFWRGTIVFGAGTKTVRYRLSTAFGQAEIDQVFDGIRGSLKWIEANPGEKPPAWMDTPLSPRDSITPKLDDEIRVRVAQLDEADALVDGIFELEARVYEEERKDTKAKLRKAFEDPSGIAVVAEKQVETDWVLVGSALAVPLESITDAGGTMDDPMRGKRNTLYSLALTVDPEFRGYGIGKKLKQAQLNAAADMKRSDGSPRYMYSSGRNRVGKTDAMMRVNKRFGAHEVFRLSGQYDGKSEASYYRIALNLGRPVSRNEETLDFASLSTPLLEVPDSLQTLSTLGALCGPTVNKLTLVNYITPAITRAVEWISALTPRHPHLYLTSSRDECFDKSLRLLRYHRKEAQIAVGLSGGYLGHTSAAARSLSDPAVHKQGVGYFDNFIRIPHGSDAGGEMIEKLRTSIKEHGADKILGIFVEAVQERTGRTLFPDLWEELCQVREEHGIPLVLFETASAFYRNGEAAFFESTLSKAPDLLAWWGGGQVGFVHTQSKWFVKKPLTFVSTWDGDELSLIRVHHQLRAARMLDTTSQRAALDAALKPVSTHASARGLGLHRVLSVGSSADKVHHALSDAGFLVANYANGCLGISPPLDVSETEIERFGHVLSKCFS